jgi:hypothetical protein
MQEIFSAEFLTNYGMKNLKDKLKTSREIKTTIMAQLINYFKWNYKINEKSFKNITLENFGLECCGSCEKNVLQHRI